MYNIDLIRTELTSLNHKLSEDYCNNLQSLKTYFASCWTSNRNKDFIKIAYGMEILIAVLQCIPQDAYQGTTSNTQQNTLLTVEEASTVWCSLLEKFTASGWDTAPSFHKLLTDILQLTDKYGYSNCLKNPVH